MPRATGSVWSPATPVLVTAWRFLQSYGAHTRLCLLTSHHAVNA